jgi:hypothetical protein
MMMLGHRAFWFCPATAKTDGASTVTAATFPIRFAMIISQPVSQPRYAHSKMTGPLP